MPGIPPMPTTLSVAPWANTEIVVAIIGALGVIGGAGGLWDYLKARKRATITAREAEDAAQKADAAAADELVATALGIVRNGEARIQGLIDRHDREMAKVNARLDAETVRGDRLELEVASLRKESQQQSREIYQLRSSIARVKEWHGAIVERWLEVRQQDEPPALPKLPMD